MGIFANKCYIAFGIKNKNTYSFANRTVSKIDDFEYFDYSEKAIIMVNRFNSFSKEEEFKELSSFTGIQMPEDFNFIAESLVYKEYIRNILRANLIYQEKNKK